MVKLVPILWEQRAADKPKANSALDKTGESTLCACFNGRGNQRTCRRPQRKVMQGRKVGGRKEKGRQSGYIGKVSLSNM